MVYKKERTTINDVRSFALSCNLLLYYRFFILASVIIESKTVNPINANSHKFVSLVFGFFGSATTTISGLSVSSGSPSIPASGIFVLLSINIKSSSLDDSFSGDVVNSIVASGIVFSGIIFSSSGSVVS